MAQPAPARLIDEREHQIPGKAFCKSADRIRSIPIYRREEMAVEFREALI